MQNVSQSIQSHKDLIVWQKSIELVCLIHELTEKYPVQEMYGLTSQMRRAAVSIPSNIAEGRRRGTKKEFLRFLRYAFGSGAELETQIEISKKLPSTNMFDFSKAEMLLNEVMRILNTLQFRLKQKP